MLFSPHITLRDEENLVEVVRRHWIRSRRTVFKASLLFLLSFFIVVPLFRYGVGGVIVFLVLLFWACYLVLREVYRWQRTALVLTTHRVLILDQFGFFDRTVIDVPYDKVVDARYRVKGVGQAVVGYGTIHVLVSGVAEPYEITHVPAPERVHRLLISLRERSEESPKEDE